MAFRCPSCNKPLYNRRRATCESCAVVIPEHLLLNAAQRQRLAEVRKQEEKEHRDFMERGMSTGMGGFDVPTSF